MVTVLLSFIATVLTIYFVWNYFNERNHRPKWAIEKDIRYYELKSKNEFLIATGSLFIIIVVFMGLNTQKDIEIKLRSEYKGLLDSASQLKQDVTDEVGSHKQMIRLLAEKIRESEKIQETITQQSKESLSSFNSINEQYAQIRSKPILNKDFYIIPEQNFPPDSGWGITFYFKDLKTTEGKSIPPFNNPPSVIASSSNGGSFVVTKITTESVHVVEAGGMQAPSETLDLPFRLRLLIFEN